MKKTAFYLLALATAMFSFASCQEEIEAPKTGATHTVVFTAEQVVTKTSLNIDGSTVNYSWNESDADPENAKFAVFENGIAADTVIPDLKDGKMSIAAIFPGENTPANAKYTAHFNSGVKTDQSGDNLEYDQDSDVMYSAEAEGDINTGLMFRFARATAFGQVTLKNLEKGQFVNSIKIESTDGAILAAEYDFTNKEFASEGSSIINVETVSPIDDNNQAVVRFAIVPVTDVMLKITATTVDNQGAPVAKYEKTFTKTISFSAGDLRVFGVQMEESPIFYESFNTNDGTGGNDDTWSGTIASSDFMSDNEGWVVERASGAKKCAKFGTTSAAGSATTPSFTLNGNATLKFKAAAWDGNSEKTLLNISATNAIISQSTVELVKGEWTEYTIQLANPTDDVTITFAAANASNNRFFLDEVKVLDGGEDFDYLEVSDTDISVGHDATSATFTITTNGNWTITGEKAEGVTLSSESGTGDATITVTFGENETSATKTLANLTVGVGELTETVVITQDANPDAIRTVTIDEFLKADVGDALYQITGTVTEIKETTHGNLYIEDNTGSVYVYGLAESKGKENTTFPNIGLKVGDQLTLVGKRAEYKDDPQVGNAYHVSHVAAPLISVDPTSLVFAAAGESKNVEVTVKNFAGNVTISAESSSSQFATSVSGTTVTITAAENTSTSDVNGTITITVSDGTSTKSAEVSLKQYGKAAFTDAVDVLDRAFTGVGSGVTTYADWSDKTSNSPARYSGNSAGGNDAVQLRTTNSNSGIVTTSPGGYLTKVEVVWNASTASGRTVQIYGSNTAYESPADLYNPIKQGTLLGTIDYETTTELSINGEYQYIGIRSASGALYLTSISITWSATAPEKPVLTGLTWTGYKNSYTVNSTFNINGTIEAIYSDESKKTLTSEDVTLTVTPDLSKEGSTVATISYTEGEITKTANADIEVVAGSVVPTNGTLRITRANFPSGSLAYNVTDSWSAVASTGDTITGEGDLYSTAAQETMQSKNSGVSTMYHNTVAIPGSITKITLKCASGSTRTYTAYMNKNTAITSTSGGTSKGTIAPTAGNTASLSLDAADGWHYFWLNLAGGASYLDYIEIEYVKN